MQLNYSIIIPVHNRPQEIEELLDSITKQSFKDDFEVVIVEDGSTITSEAVVKKFKDKLNIRYFFKDNTGPGLSRNYGMQQASGVYFIILDSDVLLPEDYLAEVDKALADKYTDVFGGADTSHSSFTVLQKAINYSMTSVLTTGGIRGNKNLKKFQPRSFNMGLSKKAFGITDGFAKQHFGEDIDLTFRLWQSGFESQFIEKAYVYHKRRNTLQSFFKQAFNFGAARPILNRQYANTAKITYWFPSLFIIGLLFSIIVFSFGYKWFLFGYSFYFMLILLDSLVKNRNVLVAATSILTTLIQFLGYGLGFLRSFFRVSILQKTTKNAFPRMFS